ncbi:substrate-binding domain-containing protein [Mycoplasma iguanae]|uniref:Substrate-binding domain-containing protein n=1 Tax=Mycoplasma iguanae TaxID=292461 RepID=A0ABY5R9V8_9MOLU|nr:substrate-binding domain-containing protein [Mycoplasma iguanae]UVD81564.1 substrate-binding domain-containing protein [Mycoplasma iguanae]
MSLKFVKLWNKIKKSSLFVIFSLGVLTAIIAGIAVANRNQPKEVISLILSTKNNPFFNEIETAVVNEFDKQNQYDLQIFDSENDDNKQVENIRNAVALGSKALIINVVNSSTAWDGGLSDVAKRNIPIFAIDRNITAPLGKITQTIASNNVQGAKDIAEWFLKKYPQAGVDNIFHLGGVQGSQAAQDREKGFKEGFRKDYLISEVADFSRSVGLAKTNDILQSRGEEFKIIFADNDEMAIGAIEAIEARNFHAVNTTPYDIAKGKYYVLGFDGTSDALKLIKENKMVATVIQQPALMGQIAAQSTFKVLKGETVESIHDAQTIVVSSDNIDQF